MTRVTVRILLAACALVGCAGCSGEKETATKPSFDLVIRDSAAEAASAAGVDIEGMIRSSAEAALARLDVPGRVRIEVKVPVDQTNVIPQIGLGGSADADGNVSLVVEEPLRAGVEQWLPALVAHELHHASRFRAGPAYRGTMAEALVTEGLADHFAEELFPDSRLPWAHALSSEQAAAMWRRMRTVLNVPDGYDHGGWFFGTDPTIPAWAGYSLGYRIVAAYLGDERHAADEADAEAELVMESYAAANG
jgi:uncharacterized protein YjaZ